MCYSLYRCASAHYRIKLDWLICRSCTLHSLELLLSVLRQEHVSPALPCTQRCLCTHHTAQCKPRRSWSPQPWHFSHSHFLNAKGFSFPCSQRRCTMCKEVLMLAPPWSGDTERQTQLTRAVPAGLNSQHSSVFPVFLDTHIPVSSHPSWGTSATHLSCKMPLAPESFKYFCLGEWICCLELPLSPLTPIVISIKRLEA